MSIPRSRTEASCQVELIKVGAAWMADAPWLPAAIHGETWEEVYGLAMQAWAALTKGGTL